MYSQPQPKKRSHLIVEAMRVTVDDPFEAAHKLDGKPKGAWQENQLPGREAGAEEPGRSGWPSADE